jgi:hypothetical protein
LLPDSDDPASLQRLSEAASCIFSLCASENASASLPWCTTALKRSVNIWGADFAAPASSRHLSSSGSAGARTDIALFRRLKSAFDPQNIFAPGRFLSP